MKGFFGKIWGALCRVASAVSRFPGFCLKLFGLVIFFIPIIYIVAIFLAIALEIAPTLTYLGLVTAVLIYLLLKLRRVFRRRKFLQDLQRICQSRGGALTPFGHPYWNALFRIRAGAVMELRDKTVVLYFLPCNNRGTRVCFTADGSAVFYESICFRRVTIFSWQHIYKWADAPEAGSYLLLMPAPNRCYVELIRPEYEVDNGSTCGQYTIFTGGAFLRHIERVL